MKGGRRSVREVSSKNGADDPHSSDIFFFLALNIQDTV